MQAKHESTGGVYRVFGLCSVRE
uniref:Uncharacterized protein n=1 Tax=Anguilla anguilla TaxID=7936 RepID=A0A0E9PA57_ANGAN